ncbi:MAG: TlpA disulfide reductase family protein [Betaproteobacteria bacterium]|nr:TlpA disulfide reductase family protein [Betaproteobacteria bacterium]
MWQSTKTMFPILAIALGLVCGMNPAGATDAAAKPARLVATGSDGRPISLADGRGRTALVIYWSPESLASRKSLHELQRFVAATENKEIFLLTVSTSSDRDKLQAFMAERKLSFPYAFRGEDDFGAIDEQRLPLVLVFDGEGRLLRQHAGMFHQKMLRRLIDSGVKP